ncbi:hypothetical protein Dda_1224 [Drechslerella dactyloides]|uniref:MARVEL domain-containing protein n=1 Tax=Drechslerella dactyloides TaxID=74499 RepID=A0AAD6J7E0_DREDA|nr:hypothetical protein Dda_1224 [Drechslerella dactyloides]
MRYFSALLGPSTLALAASVLAQRTVTYPRTALNGATDIAKNIKTFFENEGGVLAATTISRDIVDQLTILADYMQNTVFPSVNPQRFKPNGQLPERTCDQRRSIFTAYENLFEELIAARGAMQTALCSANIELPTGLVLQENAVVDPLTQKAKDMLTQTEKNLARLWDNVLGNPFNSFDFFVYSCKARFNTPGCRDPGETCPPAPEPCPVVCECYYGFVDGQNPNKDQCFTSEVEVSDVLDTARSATYGWDNVKDCRTCYPNDLFAFACILTGSFAWFHHQISKASYSSINAVDVPLGFSVAAIFFTVFSIITICCLRGALSILSAIADFCLFVGYIASAVLYRHNYHIHCNRNPLSVFLVYTRDSSGRFVTSGEFRNCSLVKLCAALLIIQIIFFLITMIMSMLLARRREPVAGEPTVVGEKRRFGQRRSGQTAAHAV